MDKKQNDQNRQPNEKGGRNDDQREQQQNRSGQAGEEKDRNRGSQRQQD